MDDEKIRSFDDEMPSLIVYKFMLPDQRYEHNVFSKSMQLVEVLKKIEGLCIHVPKDQSAQELAQEIRKTIGFLLYALCP